MRQPIRGIHHVTAIASDAQRNLDFYAGTLGLRLVKISVNQDDPGTYHFFYGDGTGRPGTGMTFFPYANAFEGTPGPGQSTAVAFRAPEDSEDYWVDRLGDLAGEPFERFGERMVAFLDPDGLQVEIAFSGGQSETAWEGGGVPKELAIVGFHGVTLTERHPEPVIAFLTAEFGYEEIARDGDRRRFIASPPPAPSPRTQPRGEEVLGTIVDIVEDRVNPHGHVAAGSIHHVAFRVPDAEAQLAWHKRVQEIGLHVSPVTERFYFKSIYFREPGGVLFEIATDGPGWTVDESLDSLGTRLFLPPWLEPRRAEIERRLPTVVLPNPHPPTPSPAGRGGA